MTDRKTLETSNEGPAIRSGGQAEKTTELITFRKMCETLGQPEYKVRYQIGALNIRHEFKVGAARIFSQASFLRIKSAIMGVANRKAAKAI